jgi:hypothetical protein
MDLPEDQHVSAQRLHVALGSAHAFGERVNFVVPAPKLIELVASSLSDVLNMLQRRGDLLGEVFVGNRGVGNLRFIGLVGLGPASRVFTFHLLDSLLTATTKISICPHMTSFSNRSKACGL